MAVDNILVTGATGRVGRELVRLLLREGVAVRAATRHPARARELFGDSVEVVELNYWHTETYDAALTWADRLFLVPPPFTPRAHEAIGPLLDWAVSTRVRHVVLLSGMAVPDDPELDLRRTELHVMAQETEHTILRPNLYMQNVRPGFISRQAARDDQVIRLAAGEGQVSLVDVRDVAEVAARVLTGDEGFGLELTLTGPEALSMAEAVRRLEREAGWSLRYRAVDDEAFRLILLEEGWGQGEAEVILELFRAIREGRRAPVHPDLPEFLGRPPRTFRDFAREIRVR